MRKGPDGIVKRTLEALKVNGIDAAAVPTTGPCTAGALARKWIDEGADLVIAMGGDGTINEIANGMAGSRIPLGVLPAGTANVLAMELGIGSRLSHAIPKLAASVPERIALGRVHSDLGTRYFVMMAGVGLDAEIVYNINASLKRALGKVAYWIGGFSHVTRSMAEFDTHVSGRRERVGFALASRVKNYGGDLEIAKGACLLENHFETVLFRGSNPLRYVGYFVGVLVGGLHKIPGATMERARDLEFHDGDGRRVYIQVDGEFAGRLPARIEIVDDALTLLVPAGYRERLGMTFKTASAREHL